jgi:NAD(P)-dependent dehydrogenase (short-subunit alcohol dehydrogenase family)
VTKPVCLVTGVGPGNGAALARRFASEGYRVAMLARSADRLELLAKEIGDAHAYPCDVADPRALGEVLERVRGELGTVEVALHNAGSGAFTSFEQLSFEAFEQAWRVNALALLALAKGVVAGMRQLRRGAIVVTGATASLRGNPMTAAFAPAKAAQRSLAQSLAKTLGPQGIHVALVVVDGVIDIPATRAFLRDRPDDFFLKPDAIAEAIWHLVQQDRSAWTFEVDLRPFGEKW